MLARVVRIPKLRTDAPQLVGMVNLQPNVKKRKHQKYTEPSRK